ncbi:hypothetical protein I4U23_019112 [Adineta vaga]|nr:hypothetical protein I4U23_019112 [Adineta vaga]
MINDYQRRFQSSLQKLTIPSWYNESTHSFRISNNKPSVNSISHYDPNPEVQRTPEIVHVQRPHSYRSYRSSKGTSPSPSVHSWHPQHMMDGMNFSPLLPSSTISTSRRHHHRHVKGIERVSKSSHWYQPTQFIPKKKNDQISTSKKPLIQQVTLKSNYYDIPKRHYDNALMTNIKSDYTSDKNIISKFCGEETIDSSIDIMKFNNVKNTNAYKKNNYSTDNHSLTNDKQDDHRINSNGFQTMPLADEKISFGRVELEDVTDEEENDKRLSTNNMHIVEEINDDEKNTLLERVATDLVDSILHDVLHSKDFEHDVESGYEGVRELSDDENALRELDENDINGTDEFIVFSAKAETLNDSNDQTNQISTIIPRGSLNRLYTFSRTNDDGSISTKQSIDQESPTTTLMSVDKEFPTTNSLLNTNPDQSTNTMINLEHNGSENSLPIYRSHIQKRHINLGRYYDGMMRATNSQIPSHDFRCNLFSNNTTPHISTDGVTEETVRQGRLLLDSIPNGIQCNKEGNENGHERSIPVRSILKNTRFADEFIPEEHILRIEEDERVSPRRIVTTTATEEYRRIQRKTTEELDENLLSIASNEERCRDSGYSSNHERSYIHQTLLPSVPVKNQSPYELLSDCYSGYSYIRSDFLIPTKSPLISIVSSLPSTTDEAYESEQTTNTSPRSPTMSSSTVATTTNNIHPELEHEFEYPAPPPPVPDRRLKPAHLRPLPPPTKPRTIKPQQKNLNVTNKRKTSKTSPLTLIQHLVASTANDSELSSARTLSSRHYCGSIPVSNDSVTTITTSAPNSPTNGKTDDNSKQNSKTLNGSTCIIEHEDNPDVEKITAIKSSISSLNKTKTNRKSSSTCFDETTNGLAIRLPIPTSDGHDSFNKQNLNRISTPSASKSIEGLSKHRPMSENLNSHRSSVYETSV